MNLLNRGPVFHLDPIQISKGFHHLPSAARTEPCPWQEIWDKVCADVVITEKRPGLSQEVVNKAWLQGCSQQGVKMLVVQPCLTLYVPMDCSPSGFSIQGILQATIPDWVAIPFYRGSSQPRD